MEERPFDEMSAPGEAAVLSVGEAVELLNQQLFRLAGPAFAVEGEVSEFGISQGKWVRFTLKDASGEAVLKCFLTVFQLQEEVKDGDRVIVWTTPKIYPRYGQLTLNVNRLETVGAGGLAAELQARKRRLEAEGLFDRSRKRALPAIPERIGLITSREAAACSDFLRILGHRWGNVEVQLFHCHVQGVQAVPDLLRALQYFNQCPQDERPDVLVMTRGGGGLEDLMAFNDEAVVRAVFASTIPIVVGIGHERDESLAEYAADVRASTPTHAAELVVPDREAVRADVDMMERRLAERLHEQLRAQQYAVDRCTYQLTHALQRVRARVEQTVSTVEHMGDLLAHRLERAQERVDGLAQFLREFDPARVLKRGYALVRKEGRVVQDASTLDTGDRLEVQFGAGTAQADVVSYAS